MSLSNHCRTYFDIVKANFNIFEDVKDDLLVPWGLFEWEKHKGAPIKDVYALSNECVDAAKVENEERYQEAVERHQQRCIGVLTDYVSYYLSHWEQVGRPGETEEQRRDNSRIAFIAEKGYEWFKFASFSINAKIEVGGKTIPYRVIPRYNEKFCQGLEGSLYLDADEMAFAKKDLNEKHFQEVIDRKSRSSVYKIFKNKEGGISSKPINKFNTMQRIRDWTINLF